MRMVVLAVFDVQAHAYMRPIFVASVGVGLRMIGDEVNRSAPDNPLFNHTKDFRVFDLGIYDDALGIFEQPPQPVLVLDCSALVAKPPV